MFHVKQYIRRQYKIVDNIGDRYVGGRSNARRLTHKLVEWRGDIIGPRSSKSAQNLAPLTYPTECFRVLFFRLSLCEKGLISDLFHVEHGTFR